MSDLETPQPKRRGVDILHDPRLNKMTGFSEEEREALGLVGLVPEGIDAETTQVQRVLHQINRKPHRPRQVHLSHGVRLIPLIPVISIL